MYNDRLPARRSPTEAGLQSNKNMVIVAEFYIFFKSLYNGLMNEQKMTNNEPAAYKLQLRKGQRSIRLRLDQDGMVVISGPLSLKHSEAQTILIKHCNWIDRVRQKLNQKTRIVCAEPLQSLRLKTQILVRERLEHYNFKFSTVQVSTAQSRWGSCSRRGNLSFSYKLAVVPPELLDYVVVHELCHLKEHNHSRSFWNLVAVHIPNHKECRKALRGLIIE
jgi:hypothetical protein